MKTGKQHFQQRCESQRSEISNRRTSFKQQRSLSNLTRLMQVVGFRVSRVRRAGRGTLTLRTQLLNIKNFWMKSGKKSTEPCTAIQKTGHAKLYLFRTPRVGSGTLTPRNDQFTTDHQQSTRASFSKTNQTTELVNFEKEHMRDALIFGWGMLTATFFMFVLVEVIL